MIGRVLKLRYEVTEELDLGPVFQLFRAKDRTTGRDVYLRQVRDGFASDPEFLEELRGSVRSLSVVQHPNVERYIDVVTDEGITMIVSEGPPGQSLDERIKRLAPYSIPVCISLAIQILESLQSIHQYGFVHGELSSHCIMVSGDGKVSLLQPGLWTAYGASPSTGTAVMARLGPYLAPEVYAGKMPTPCSDVYSVGVLLFELLTAKQPFIDDSLSGLARKHSTSPIPSLQFLNSSVPSQVEELVRRALSKDPSARYPNAKSMLVDLKAMQEAIRFNKPIPSPSERTVQPAQEEPTVAVATESTTTEVVNPIAAMAPQPAIAVAPIPAPTHAEPAREEGIDLPPTRVAKREEPVLPPVEAKHQGPKPIEPPKPVKMPKPPKPDKDPEKMDKLPGCISFAGYASVLALIVIAAGWVYWNLTAPVPTKVPNVIGKTEQQANELLQKTGLQLKVVRTEYTERKPAGAILETSPKPGADARENSFVTAVISGGPRFVKVPDLRGDTPEEAAAKLNELKLTMSDVVEEIYRRGQKEGTIIEQIPEPGSEVDRGTKVRIGVASRRDRRSASERVQGEYELVLRMPLDNDAVYVRVDLIDADGTRTVYPDTLLQPGDIRQILAKGRGRSVDFKVFFNGKLVKQVTKNVREE